MRECIFFLCLWCGIIGGAEAVSPGIQHFDRYRSLLEGKKVGIVANQTAVLETGDGYKHSVDFLRDHRVQLIRIFCPEHGFRGDADAGETVGDYRDRQRVSKKYLAPSIYSYPYWRLKSNIRFYKGVFCLFGHPLFLFSYSEQSFLLAFL